MNVYVRIECRAAVSEQLETKLANSVYKLVIKIAEFFTVLDNDVPILTIGEIILAQVGAE